MNIEQIITRIKNGPNDITLYPAATQQLFDTFEAKTRLVLPHDFKCFYSFSNGFQSDEDLFRIIPLEEIMDDWRCATKTNNQCYFAEYLIYSDLWGVEAGFDESSPYSIFYPYSEERKLLMTHSLAEFLERFLLAGIYGTAGLNDWSNDSLPLL
ncbi:SMI1/KNR4 family protein [Hymenobacter cheonanensis]|uniref:SMI1/KNR4 family protein n=1 Tax=Hymenobacter sp. CA2-7 TaxID=3063993 RepID=UPI00271239BC|nr:SMI1/KNR4 family protein [Hymenobacter sp. CA2-7]MDO7883844.1 SMI1/KNR4 family protein [Hymenobacter sp. CA2-7]